MLDADNWAQVIVAVIALGSAWFAKQASKSSSKTQAETEAYIRARKLDTETIERQQKDIERLREKVKDVVDENEKLKKNFRDILEKNEELVEDNIVIHRENEELRRRVRRLEMQLGEQHE